MKLLVLVVVFVVGAGITAARTAAHKRAMREPIGTETCIACSGTEMLEKHPDAWVCTSCGYEQGPGWERQRQAQHLERLMALPPEKAMERARAQLEDAHLALVASLSPLQRPTIIEGSGRQRREVINPEILDAAQNLAGAFDGLQEAAMLWPEAAEALQDAGFPTDGSRPTFDDLYAFRTVKAACSRLRPVVTQAVGQLEQANRALGLA